MHVCSTSEVTITKPEIQNRWTQVCTAQPDPSIPESLALGHELSASKTFLSITPKMKITEKQNQIEL